MCSIRVFLENNKIFFEVFSYIVVGIAGIMFSYYQYKSNERQIELQKSQIDMQKNEAQPIFRVAFLIDSQKENNDTEIMEIYNEGNPFKLLRNCGIKTFYELKFSSHKDGINSTYYVPIAGFYYIGKETHNLTGKLLTKYFPDNHAKFVDIYRDCINQSENDRYIFISRFSLIQINYVDVYNETQTVYFKDEIQIKNDNYENIINKSNEVFNMPIGVEEASLEMMSKHILKLNLPGF